jgi:hypothetical protein
MAHHWLNPDAGHNESTLCVLLTVLELVVRKLMPTLAPGTAAVSADSGGA